MLRKLPETLAAKPVGAPGRGGGGGGGGGPISARRAALTLISGFGISVNGSVMVVPVPASAARIGGRGRRRRGLLQARPKRQPHAVWPSRFRSWSSQTRRPAQTSLMPTPGASRSTAIESLLNTGTYGRPGAAFAGHSKEPGHTPLVVAPTATAVEMHAGAEIAQPDEVVTRCDDRGNADRQEVVDSGLGRHRLGRRRSWPR